MIVKIKTNALIVNPLARAINLGKVGHMDYLTVIHLSNLRELAEYLQLRNIAFNMWMDNPTEYLHEIIVVHDSNNDKEGIIYRVDDVTTKLDYLSAPKINLKKLRLTEASTMTTSQIQNTLSNLEFNYQSYQPQHTNANSNVTLTSVEVIHNSESIAKVRNLNNSNLTLLNDSVKMTYNIANKDNSINLVFILAFSNGKAYKIPYTLSSEDINHLCIFRLLRSYCDLMKNCIFLFDKVIVPYMNQVQQDALEISDFNW
ncbi:hypothetical protein [Calidifontibacillus oryziterrae]|uniref:hypothetical protein n=1 Tax=Calidifontibacillus oryziterrae TaxID=1191699 RepID=UPI0002E36AD2|nr:hypothetical protein [Calidifontibacillus oryziterrae]